MAREMAELVRDSDGKAIAARKVAGLEEQLRQAREEAEANEETKARGAHAQWINRPLPRRLWLKLAARQSIWRKLPSQW